MALNDHPSLPEGQLHPPKGFSTAGTETRIKKNLNSQLEWSNAWYHDPVLDFVDINAAPPTEVDGDRYVLITVTSSVEHTDWDNSPTPNDIVEYFASEDEWKVYDPVEGDILFDKDTNDMYSYNGTSWSAFGNGTDNNGIYTGSGTVPTSVTATLTDTITYSGGQLVITDSNAGSSWIAKIANTGTGASALYFEGQDTWTIGSEISNGYFEITNNDNLGATNTVLIGSNSLIVGGLSAPSTGTIHSYNNNSVLHGTAQHILAEQEGTGDSTIRLALTGGEWYDFYIDNSEANDNLKIESSQGLHLNLDPINDTLAIDPACTFANEATFNGDVTIAAAGVLTIPRGTSPTTNASGEIALDTDGDGATVTSGVLKVYDGTNQLYGFLATGYPSSDNDVMAYDSATNRVTWQAQAGGVGTESVNIFLLPNHNTPPTSNPATLDTRNNHKVLDFDDATDESAVFSAFLKGYNGGGLTVKIIWAATSATTGNVVWNAEIERIQDDVTDIDSDSFAAANAVTATTASASGETSYDSITFTDGADMDSLADGEAFRIRITRDANNVSDTMTGDAELWGVCIVET